MNIICGLGLIPFLIVFIKQMKQMKQITCLYKYIPLFVFMNGICYHIIYNDTLFFKIFDILCNIIFIIYINISTENQPYTSVITYFVFLMYYINTYIYSDLIHVLLIQMPLLHLYINADL